MSDPVVDEIAAARDALADAHILFRNDGTDAAIVNRLYYACFHSARAVLYDQRQRADYAAGELSVDPESLSERAAEFVEAIERLI